MAASRRKKKTCKSGLLFFGGFFSGIAVAGVLWLQLLSPQALQNSDNNSQTEDSRLPPKPHFDFYTVLPEMEVVVPDEEVNRSTPRTSQANAKDKYLLQIGSFRRLSDADRQKASLALLGIEADIQRVSINGNESWHRVRSGPYQGKKQLNEVRKRLKSNGINAMVIRLKKSG
ncbi:MAG: SPOR domain-containing protein [gamma proteobacterium symbiont of Bathyaustriella thionipta]|nr:SPOR domain-containing protein [gamma proteobacterium symbiont of Bathyaustriella thionipta]